MKALIPAEIIERRILLLRGQKVMLDMVYGSAESVGGNSL
jgi:hypothetical protein